LKLNIIFKVFSIEKHNMKKLLLILCITIGSQAIAQKDVAVPTIAFKAPLGKTITRNEVSITLSEILEDSRCPSDVTCVWAGRIRAKVVVSISGKQTETVVVVFERGKQTVLATTENCIFKAIKISPYPSSANKNDLAYELLVVETCTISEEE
jgi:hypothetical protein